MGEENAAVSVVEPPWAAAGSLLMKKLEGPSLSRAFAVGLQSGPPLGPHNPNDQIVPERRPQMARPGLTLRRRVVALGLAFAAVLATTWGLGPSWAGQDPEDDQDEALNKQVNQPVPEGPRASFKKTTLPKEWVRSFRWRSIGPAGMGGRITAISVFEADPNVYWVASAGGGLTSRSRNLG